MNKLIIKPLDEKIDKYQLIGKIEEVLTNRINRDSSYKNKFSQCSAYSILDFLLNNRLISQELYNEVFEYYQTKYDVANK